MNAKPAPSDPDRIEDKEMARPDDDQGVPLCTNCLAANNPHASHCTKCGATLGPLAGVYPYAPAIPWFQGPVSDDATYSKGMDWTARIFFATMAMLLFGLGVLSFFDAIPQRGSRDAYAGMIFTGGGVFMLYLLRKSFVAFQRLRRRASGQCEQCGYSLTGLVSVSCPECGTDFKAVPKRNDEG